MDILKSILLVTIFMGSSFSVPVDKWNKSEDLPTFFINTEQKVKKLKLLIF